MVIKLRTRTNSSLTRLQEICFSSFPKLTQKLLITFIRKFPRENLITTNEFLWLLYWALTYNIVFISLCFKMRDKLNWPFFEYWINVMKIDFFHFSILPCHCCTLIATVIIMLSTLLQCHIVIVMQTKLTVIVVAVPTHMIFSRYLPHPHFPHVPYPFWPVMN